MDYYGDDTWISSAVSFNPYQCELVPLQVMYYCVIVAGDVFCTNCNVLVACEILLCNILLLLRVLVAYGEYCVYYIVTVPDT